MFATLGRLEPWAWGDWQLELARRAVSNGGMKRWMEAQHLTYGTLHNYKSIAKAFPRSRRREKLTIGHHAAVAALTVAEANKLLKKAEANGTTREVLRAEVKALLNRDDDEDDTPTT